MERIAGKNSVLAVLAGLLLRSPIQELAILQSRFIRATILTEIHRSPAVFDLRGGAERHFVARSAWVRW